MDQPTLPIFVLDINGVDMGVYASLHDAESHLEPIDVRNNEYVAYDGEGRLLRLETDGKRVKVSLGEEKPNHAKELEIALKEFLKAMNEPIANDPSCNLADLVTASKKFIHK